MDNDNNQNPDAPLKAFATFWVGLAAFAAFGVVGLAAYKLSGGAKDGFYEKDMERRTEIRTLIDGEQKAEMDKISFDIKKAAADFDSSPEIASTKPAPGTPSQAKMMKEQMAVAKAAADKKKAEEEANKPASEGTGTTEVAAQQLTLTPVANVMQFEQKTLNAKTGSPIELTFNNTDVLMHNVLILKPGTKDAVGAIADAGIADPEGMAKGYIPDSPDIIAHTKLLQSTQSETIKFTIDTPGEYPYICTFPGHWRIMQGILIVEKGDAPAPATPAPIAMKAQDLELTPIANVMQFEQKELRAKAGVPINITFSNTDVLMHNVLVLKPGTKDAVGALADAGIADPEGMAKGYIPDSPDIIAHTKLLQSTQSETITFTIDTPGEYPYICTFPGHWRLMQGILIVEKGEAAVAPVPAPTPAPVAAKAQDLELTPIANVMQFEQKELKAKAGIPINLTFSNTDVLMHNVLLLKPGTTDKVGALADAGIADPEGMAKGYIPESDDIIAHTKLLMSAQTETISFTLEAGRYPYICTFPGHWRLMQGVLIVE